jgi:hypothetical protein
VTSLQEIRTHIIGYFTTSAAVAGSLIGLLFVSISLRYEAILGKSADFRSRAAAGSSFTGLFNALTISLWALIPDGNLGYAALVSAATCLLNTLKLHGGKLRRGGSLGTFVLSMAVYLAQGVNGALLIARPHSSTPVHVLAYTLFGALASSLSRAWELLQPGDRTGEKATSGGTASQ